MKRMGNYQINELQMIPQFMQCNYQSLPTLDAPLDAQVRSGPYSMFHVTWTTFKFNGNQLGKVSAYVM